MAVRGLQADTITAATDPGNLDPKRWRKATLAMEVASNVYRDAAASSGMFNVQQQRIVSQTEKYTELLRRQKIGIGEIIKNRKVLNATYREQLAMERMTATMWGTDSRGRQIFDVTTPRIVGEELNNINRRLGFTRSLIASASTQMVNLGKNTQWAGRQLMVGFTMPTLFAGVAAGAAFHQADKELTRIAKVYDTMRVGEGRLAELTQLRADSMHTATVAAKEYGAAMQDTLQVQADLAATGQRGVALQEATNEVMRIAKLGELDRQAATETTIALQNAFKLNTKQLTETFNFFNATENATSLSLQDIAEAVPRAASAMAALNVTAEEMTVMLVAMRERGVDAAEGANALKSATTRILRPVAAAKDYYDQFNISIEQLSEQSGGNLFKFLKLLGEETKGLTDQQKAAGVAALFGTYQFNRLNAAVAGIGDAMNGGAKGMNQTNKAMELMNTNAGKLADLADRELAQSMESASGRFQKAVATMKVELAKLGEPFHDAATSFVNFATGILEFINNMPQWAKKGLVFTAMLAAIVGPVIMLSGLFLNFAGNIGKAMAWILRLTTSFEVLTKAQRLAQIHNQLVERSMDPATAATQRLEAEVRDLATAFQMASNEARKMMGIKTGLSQMGIPMGTAPITPTGQPMTQAQWARMQQQAYAEDMRRRGQIDFSGPLNYGVARGSFPSAMEFRQKQGFMSAQDRNLYRQMSVDAAHAEALQMDKERTKQLRIQAGTLDSIGASMAISAAAMGAMALSSNQTVDDLAMMAMTAAMLAPAIKPVAAMFKSMFSGRATAAASTAWGKISEKVSNVGFAMKENAKVQSASFKATKASGGVWKALGGVMTGVLGSSLGIGAAIAAAGFAAYKLWQHSKNIDKEVKNIYGDAQGLADIYGYTYKEGAVMAPGTGEDVTAAADRVEMMREKYSSLVDEIKAAKGPQEKFNLALMQGYKVITSGGSQEEAIQATQDALRAAEGVAAAKEIFIKFRADIDFSNAAGIAEVAQRVSGRKLQDALGMVGEKDWAEKGVDAGSWFLNGFNNLVSLGMYDHSSTSWQKASKKAAAVGEIAGQDYYNGFVQAFESGNTQAAFNLAKSFQKELNVINKEIDRARAEGNEDEEARLKDLRRIIAQGWLEEAGFSQDQIDKMGIDDYASALQLLKDSGYELTTDQERQLAKLSGSWTFLDEAVWDATSGILKAASGNGQLAASSDKSANALNRQAEAARKARAEFMKDWSAGDFAKDIWTNTTSDVADRMQSEFDANMESSLENLRDAADQRMENFDAETQALEDGWDAREERMNKHWERTKEQAERAHEQEMRRLDKQIKAIENQADRRISAVDKTIDREQKAEEIRQRIFEAEMTRVERMNKIQNQNIDFATALNTGELDEAAKIMNDMAAQEQTWALEDANRQGESASERRVSRLEKQQERMQKLADKRIAKLEKERDRLERAHERNMRQLEKLEEKQREQFEKARELAQRAREQKRKWLEKEVDDVVKAEEKKWESRKKNMDKAMDQLRAFIPRSERELNNHIERLGKRYNLFGNGLERKGNHWAKVVGNALTRNINESRRQLQNELDWEATGKQVARRLVRGAFGISLNQFKDWMVTNERQRPNRRGGGGGGGGPSNTDLARKGQGPLVRHAGGPVGFGTGGDSRVGYAKSATPYPSEYSALLKRGEYVVQDRAVNKYGVDFMNKLNDGKVPYGTGNGDIGLAGGLAGAVMKYAFKMAVMKVGENVMAQSGTYGAAKAGVYGQDGIRFDAEQLANAAIIASVGSGMGMSQRDITIGLMTAMQESMLRNLRYGDRDSQGLFQQRPSQGWGTVAQVTNPEYAARKFFEGLKGVKDRDSMPMTLAAQAVQRSAYPYAYAKWADEARDILRSMTVAPGGGYVAGPGGKHRPVDRRYGLTQGIHGTPPAVDFGLPVGSPVYAVADGRVSKSYDIRGYEPRAAHGGLGYRSYGRVIVLDHAGGGGSLYAHLSQRSVATGQRIRGGSVIGRSGNTGNSTGPHLHFGTYGMNPMNFVSLRKGAENIRWDNTIANLHRGESVLTEDLSTKFKKGVDNFAEGGKTEYNVTVEVHGETVSADEIAKTVVRTIKREEARKGIRRTAGGTR